MSVPIAVAAGCAVVLLVAIAIGLVTSRVGRRRDLAGEVALVTGAANGAGECIARRLAALGATAVLWDVDEPSLRRVVADIRLGGGRAFGQIVDVSNSDDVCAAAKFAVHEAGGPVTILVNNAGVASVRGLLELTDAQIKRTFDVNALSHFWTARAFLPHMLAPGGRGHIVTVGSVLGRMGVPNLTDYCASKAAVSLFHESLALELASKGVLRSRVRMTLVTPATMRTRMFEGAVEMPFFRSLDPEQVADAVVDAVLAGHTGTLAIPLQFYALPAYMALPLGVKAFLAALFKIDKALLAVRGTNDGVAQTQPQVQRQQQGAK